jgi:hypothetical protein
MSVTAIPDNFISNPEYRRLNERMNADTSNSVDKMLQVSLFARAEESPSVRVWAWPARSLLMASDLSIFPATWVWQRDT